MQFNLILGLGNVGEQYVNTRHNIGFEVLDLVAHQLHAGDRQTGLLYDWAGVGGFAQDLTLAWPKTYMNRSGRAAVDLLDRLELATDQMLVIVDDFNLPLGALRFRRSGSDGGHNGLASLIDALCSEDFPRLRIGIGEPEGDEDVVDFVLGRFEHEERKVIDPVLRDAAEATIFAIDHHFEEVMSRYNRNPAQPD